MSNESLTPAQHREVEQIAELAVRRYFDHYLRDVWPQQQQALKDHTNAQIQAHDDAETAHGRVEKRVNRIVWMVIGATIAGAGAGGGLVRLLMTLSA